MTKNPSNHAAKKRVPKGMTECPPGSGWYVAPMHVLRYRLNKAGTDFEKVDMRAPHPASSCRWSVWKTRAVKLDRRKYHEWRPPQDIGYYMARFKCTPVEKKAVRTILTLMGSLRRAEVLANARYLCNECAPQLGGRWPRGHCATCHSGICDVCGQQKTLSCTNDWLWGKETELKEWD